MSWHRNDTMVISVLQTSTETCSSHDLFISWPPPFTCLRSYCMTILLLKDQVSILADFLFWVTGRQRTHWQTTSNVSCRLNGRGTTAWNTVLRLLLDVDIPETESWGEPAHQHCSVVHQMMLVAAATPTVSCQRQIEPLHQPCDCTVLAYIVTKSLVTTLTVEPGLLLLCMSVYVVLTQKTEHKWCTYIPCT